MFGGLSQVPSQDAGMISQIIKFGNILLMTDRQRTLIDEIEFWAELIECKKQGKSTEVIQRLELVLKLASQKLETQLKNDQSK